MYNAQVSKERNLYIQIFYDLGFHGRWLDANGNKMLSAPEEVLLQYLEMIKEIPIYRIRVNDDHTVETMCYDMLDNFNPELKNYYETLDDLPKWVQDKLAVLMLLDPSANNNEIKNVGRRISEDVYWVFSGETNANDPRREG